MEEISEEIEKYIAKVSLFEKGKEELSMGRELEITIASKYNALALYLGWSNAIAICPNLSFISFDYDNDIVTEEVAEEWKIVSLAEASKRFPMLKKLLPSKTQDAIDCKNCNSLGTVPVNKQLLLCSKCLGLGWINEHILFLSNRFCRLP
jgi:hypothetical protein